MNSATASCASSSIVVDSKNARSFSGSDGIVRTLPWSADDTFGDAGHSATGVEGPRTKTKGWGTDLVPVPQPFGEQARMPGGGTWPRGPVLPRPRRNSCNRIRSSGTRDCPRGRTPSVHTPRRTPWLSRPVARVEGARRSVSLDGHTRSFDLPAQPPG